MGRCEEGSIRGKSMVMEKAVRKCLQVVANIAGVHVACLIDLQVGVGRVNSDRGFLPLPPQGEGQPTDGYIIMDCDNINTRVAVPYVGFVEANFLICGQRLPGLFFFVMKHPTNQEDGSARTDFDCTG